MNSLISQIEDAFRGVELEDGASLNMSEYNDSGGCMEHFLELAKTDERKDWTIIPDRVLEDFTVIFNFTDWKGFRFYLPAYMRWKINNETSNSIIGDFTIYSLNPETIISLYKKPINEILGDKQLLVVREFLKWCCGKNNEGCDSDTARSNLEKLEIILASA